MTAQAATLSILNKAISIIDGLYSLNDLHKASGNDDKHRPTFFLRNAQTKALVEEINQCENSHTAVKVVNGGNGRGTYVCRELVYAYAMWISAKFHLLVIRAFDAMCKGEAQTPAIPPINPHLSLRDAVHAAAKGNRQHYSAIYKRLYRRFQVISYHDIPADQCGYAIEYIRSLDGEYIPREKITPAAPALAPPDGQHYVVAKDGVVLYHKVLSQTVGQDAMPGTGVPLDHVAATNFKTVLNQAVIFSEMWRNNLRPMLQAVQSPLLAQVGDGVSVMGCLAKMLVNQYGGGCFDLSTGKNMAVQAR